MRCRTSVAKVSTRFRSRICDPGPDGRLGTARRHGPVDHLLRVPREPGGRLVRENDVHQQRSRGFEVQVLRSRVHETAVPGMADRGSYSTTWLDIPIQCGAAGTGLGSGIPLIWYPTRCATNPNQAFNTANNTREWQVKVSGAYNLPWGILASANYDIRSGLKQARQVVFSPGADHSVDHVERGAHRQHEPPEHPRVGHPSGEAGESREARRTLDRVARGHLQCAEQGDGQVAGPCSRARTTCVPRSSCSRASSSSAPR